MRPLFLIGFMGAGKTTVGRLLAARLGRPFTDLDRAIEEATGLSIDELFAQRGEDGFRDAEYTAVVAAAAHPDAVIACGGGIVTHLRSRGFLEDSGAVVYLRVSADEAMARLGGATFGRPLLAGADPAGAAAMMGLRARLYEIATEFSVDTVGRTPRQVAEGVAAWVELQP